MKLKVNIFNQAYWLVLDLEEKPLAQDLIKLVLENCDIGKANIAKTGSSKTSTAKTNNLALFVDGQFFKPETPIEKCQIFEGSDIDIYPPEQASTEIVLATTGGLESGKWIGLDSNSKIIGRNSTADLQINCPAVSPRHLIANINAEGQTQILDLDSTNGTWVGRKRITAFSAIDSDSRIRIGNSRLQFLRVPAPHLPKAFGYILHKRSHSQDNNKERLDPLEVPQKDKSIKNKISFSWAALVAPVLFGIVMAVLFNPYMAFFALMSPLMSVGSWLESKYRKRHSRIQLGQKQVKELHYFSKQLNQHRENEMGIRQSNRLNPLKILWALQNADPQLWERRTHHPKFLHLSLGSCDLNWQPTLQDSANFLEAAIEKLEKLKPLFDVPLELPFEKMTLGIVGPHNVSAGLARWLIIQAAFLHGPSDLNIRYAGSLPEASLPKASLPKTSLPKASLPKASLLEDWEWLKWLPHFVPQNGNYLQTHELFLIDTFQSALNPIEQIGDTTATIILAPNFRQLRRECTAIIEIQNDLGEAQLKLTDNSQSTSTESTSTHSTCSESIFKIDGISKDFATNCGRYLTRYKDSEATSSLSLPNEVGLGELLNLSRLDIKSQIQTWQIRDHQIRNHQIRDHPILNQQGSNLSIPIAQTSRETLFLDLVNDGPHGLIAGTTGSGKSELLRTIVAGLAQAASPEIINFALIDFKGGSAFDMFADLPHTVSILTDLNLDLSERALISLQAELTRRERILRSVGAEDIKDFYLKTNNTSPLPRLLILVDEFASMAEELPTFLSSLVEVARRGRSLGVHLILATQRPSGVINANILANTNFRICLRTLSQADSLDVLDSTDAAFLPKEFPGRACMRIGMDPVKVFQTARASSVTPTFNAMALFPTNAYSQGINTGDTNEKIGNTVNTAKKAKGGKKAKGIKGVETEKEATDIEKIITLAISANQELKIAKPHKPIADPLPKVLDMNEVEQTAQSSIGSSIETSINIGLVDIPEKQTLELLEWEPSVGNLGLVGKKSSEWLLALTLTIAKHKDFKEIFIFDFSSNVSSNISNDSSNLKILENLSICRGICEPDNIELRNQILDILKRKLKAPRNDRGNDTENNGLNDTENIGLNNRLNNTENNRLNKGPTLCVINNLETLLGDLESEGNFPRLELLERLFHEGPSSQIHWMLGLNSLTNSARRIQKRTYLRIYTGLRTSTDYLEAGIAFKNNLESNPMKELLGDGQEVRIMTSKNPKIENGDFINSADSTNSGDSTDHTNSGDSGDHINSGDSTKRTKLPRLKTLPNLIEALEFGEAPISFGVKLNYDFTEFEEVSFDMKSHLLISGPTASGKSNALLALASAYKNAAQPVPELSSLLVPQSAPLLACICSKNSPLYQHSLFDICEESPEALDKNSTPTEKNILLVVDDLDLIEDSSSILFTLARNSQVQIAAAGRNDLLYGYRQPWMDEVKKSRNGLLLNPSPLDGELLGVAVGKEISRNIKGRAFMVSGSEISVCQIFKSSFETSKN